MSSVDIRNLRKSFGPTEVLHGVSFTIPDGAFVALVGPSGCGKSTILRLLAGLEEVSDGELLIDDRVINDVEAKNRDIAMVFQNYALYPHMTVAENMGFSLRLMKRSKSEIKTAVKDVAEVLGIGELLDRLPKQLSGGQRQRVAMGRAIVRQPKVFLFDEPLSNLDAKLRVQMRAELKALHHRLQTTTIYVTHDQIEAMTMADIVVVMRDGFIEQVGRPLDLYDKPKNKFVAGFIGSPAMNFLRVTTAAGSSKFSFDDGQSITFAKYKNLQGEYLIGIRPEHFQQQKSKNGLSVTIEALEQTGAETLLQCQFNGQQVVIVLHERFVANPGDQYRFSFSLSDLQLFEAETGMAIST
jgi:multiple sugar transport system ATP-binding protein